MARPILIIDVYNVLHVEGVLPPDLAGVEVEGLADLLLGSRWRDCQVVLVCDGTRGPTRPAIGDDEGAGTRVFGVRGAGSIRVVYPGPGRDADSHIESLIADHSAPRRLLVVSSDRRIQVAARSRRARVMTSDEFLRALAEDARRGSGRRPGRPIDEAPLEDREVKSWLEEFGVTDAELSTPRKGDPLRQPAEPPAPEDARIEDEWRGIDDRDDLDMTRWLDSVDKLDDDD